MAPRNSRGKHDVGYRSGARERSAVSWNRPRSWTSSAPVRQAPASFGTNTSLASKRGLEPEQVLHLGEHCRQTNAFKELDDEVKKAAGIS